MTTNGSDWRISDLPERRIWLAVLVQALEDWRSANLRRHREAQTFLFSSQKNFVSVCANAGIDAGSLFRKLASRTPPVSNRNAL